MPAVGYTGGDPNKVSVSGDTMTGVLVLDDASPAASEAYVASHGGSGLPAPTVFDPREFRSGVGQGDASKDGPAIQEACLAMANAPNGGVLILPGDNVTYQANRDDLLRVWPDGQYCMFPLPYWTSDSTHGMRTAGIVGPGRAVQSRNFIGNDGQVRLGHSTSVLQINYDTPSTYDPTNGHPSVFGFPDRLTSGKGFSAAKAYVNGVIIRQPDNPSMCGINLGNAATAEILDYWADTNAFPDWTSEPTHPTGIPLLLPATGNAAWVQVQHYGAWGYYLGLPIAEHLNVTEALIVACKIAAGFPWPEAAHTALIASLSAEECPWGFAGYDPTQPGPNGAVIDCPNWEMEVQRFDIEDFDRGGRSAWMYTPTIGAHLLDGNNALHATIRSGRVNSGSTSDAGYSALYVVGGSQTSLYVFGSAGSSSTRLTGTAPVQPPSSPPDPPTIGSATAGDAQATVNFTPAVSGAVADSFTATSSPGGLTGTGGSSPIVVTGLTNGTPYTFTVHASNDAGDSDESAASNSVTPSSGGGGPTVYAADTFARADSSSTLGTSSGGQVWTALNGTWGIKSDAAYLAADGGGNSYNVATLDAGHSLVTYTASITPQANPIDLGLVALVQDIDNFVFWDISGNPIGDPTGVTTRLFHRSGGSFSGITNAATITMNPATTYQLKMVLGATQIDCYIDDTLIFSSSGATGLESQTKFGLIMATAQNDQGSTWTDLSVTSS